MNSDTRLRLEMGTRIRGFNRDHPSDDPGHAAAVTRLEEQLARVEVPWRSRNGPAISPSVPRCSTRPSDAGLFGTD